MKGPRLMVVPIFDGVVLLDLAVLDVFTGANMLAAAAGIPGTRSRSPLSAAARSRPAPTQNCLRNL